MNNQFQIVLRLLVAALAKAPHLMHQFPGFEITVRQERFRSK